MESEVRKAARTGEQGPSSDPGAPGFIPRTQDTSFSHMPKKLCPIYPLSIIISRQIYLPFHWHVVLARIKFNQVISKVPFKPVALNL